MIIKIFSLFWLCIFTIVWSESYTKLLPKNKPLDPALKSLCFSCHGENGVSDIQNVPNLAGQNVKYLVKQMEDYKNGTPSNNNNYRYDVIMTPLMQSVTADQRKSLALYFSNLPVQVEGADGSFSDQLLRGKQLYHAGNLRKGLPACSSCHSPAGKGNLQAGFPQLSGQRKDYMMLQLQKYRSNMRYNDDNQNKMMQNITQRMDDYDMEAVTNYISGLQEAINK